MYSEALREVKKGRNPFAQATNRASRNAKPLPEEGNGLTEDDLQAATREGLLTAVDAASESLAEVLSSVTESETKWNADTASSGVAMTPSDGCWLRSLRSIKQAILTALGDLVRYHSRSRTDPSNAGRQARPGSADNNFAMRYYAQAKLDAPWSGRVLQHMGKLHFSNNDLFDAVERSEEHTSELQS